MLVLRVLIADDEMLSREAIKLLIARQSDSCEILEARDGNQALAMALKYQPQLIFLDIEMPGMSGIELAKKLPEKCLVVFVTAYTEYAVMAFEVNAIDYLLKPYDDERFTQAFTKAMEQIAENFSQEYAHIAQFMQKMRAEQHRSYRKRLVIKDLGRIRLIDVSQIEYITGAGNYAEIHRSEGGYVLHRETLTNLETQLDPDVFVRIHRSSIVRKSSIKELKANDSSDYTVILTCGKALAIARGNFDKLGL
ncbi:MAG: two-component system LytT family response regulator [Paraglaciecola sp.]|jgi:two-component system LytT family response regulator